MSIVEQEYQKGLDRMSGTARVLRTCSLFGSICEMLSLQIKTSHPNLDEHTQRRMIAERLYLTDKSALALLQKVR